MTAVSRGLPKTQRFVVIATVFLVECVVWLNTANSAVAKLPLFSIGALVSGSLMLAACLIRGKCTFPTPTVQALIVLHIPLFVLSALTHNDPAYTREALSFGLSCLVFFFAGSTLFPSKKSAGRLFAALERLTLVLCLIAAAQYFLREFLPLDFHSGTGGRVASLLGNTEYFATYLVTLTPLVIAQVLNAGGKGRFALLRWGLPVSMVLLLFATQSRSGILGCVVSLFLFAFLASGRRGVSRTIITGGILIASLVITVTALRPDLVQRMWKSAGIQRGSSIARRVFFWQGGKEAFIDFPLSGHGIGSYERTLFEYRSPGYWEAGGEDVVPHAHNEVVEIAVEYGTIGLLLFAGTLTAILWKGFRTARRTGGWEGLTSAAIVSGIAGIAVDGLASVSLRQPSVAVLAWLLMGILMSPAMAGRHEGLRSVRRRLPRGAATVPLVLCLVGVTATLANAIHAIGSDTHILRGAIIPDRQSPAIAQEYREAVEDHPFNLQARSGLTLAYLDAGRWTDALNSSEELKALSPRYPKNHLMRAYALFRLSRPREALRDIGMELKERSHPESYMIEAAVFRSLADTQGERNALTNLLRSDIRGGIPYGVQSSIARLTELCTTGAERGEAASLFDSLAVRFDLRPPPGLKHRDGD